MKLDELKFHKSLEDKYDINQVIPNELKTANVTYTSPSYDPSPWNMTASEWIRATTEASINSPWNPNAPGTYGASSPWEQAENKIDERLQLIILKKFMDEAIEFMCNPDYQDLTIEQRLAMIEKIIILAAIELSEETGATNHF